jgi:hypothetical protein
VEDSFDVDESAPKKQRTQESVREFKQEIEETRARVRHFAPVPLPVPDDLHVPIPLVRPPDPDDDEEPPAVAAISFRDNSSDEDTVFDQSPSGARSNGEFRDGDANNGFIPKWNITARVKEAGPPESQSHPIEEDEDVYNFNRLSARRGLIAPYITDRVKELVIGVRALRVRKGGARNGESKGDFKNGESKQNLFGIGNCF